MDYASREEGRVLLLAVTLWHTGIHCAVAGCYGLAARKGWKSDGDSLHASDMEHHVPGCLSQRRGESAY